MEVGKFGLRLLSSDINLDPTELEPSRICSILFNRNFRLKDGDDIDCKEVEVGVQDEAELECAIDDIVAREVRHLEKDSQEILKNTITEFKNIFCTRLGKDPPIDVETMNIEFEGFTCPIKFRQRSYSPKQLYFLKTKVHELIDAGEIFHKTRLNGLVHLLLSWNQEKKDFDSRSIFD